MDDALSLDPARQALARELERHPAADPSEAASRLALLDLVTAEPRCFERSLFAPGHVVGSLFVVHPPTGRVLLHHHRRLGRWLQFGGHDEGERDARATALREGFEESGLADLVLLAPEILDVDVHPIPAAKGEPDHRHFDVRWAASTATPDAAHADEAESKGLQWLPLADAIELVGEPGGRRALRKLARFLAPG